MPAAIRALSGVPEVLVTFGEVGRRGRIRERLRQGLVDAP